MQRAIAAMAAAHGTVDVDEMARRRTCARARIEAGARRRRVLRSGAPDPRFPRVHHEAADGRFFQCGLARRRVTSGHEDHSGSNRGFAQSPPAVPDPLPGLRETVGAPDCNVLRFVILARPGAELMLQTLAGIRKDKRASPGTTAGPDLCPPFIEGNDFKDARRRRDGYPIPMAVRRTFCGMVEKGALRRNSAGLAF